MFKKILLSILLVMALAPCAWAVPNLQVYIPGSIYDFGTESWTINSNNVELWVIGANQNIYDVKFAAAVPLNEDGSFEVTWLPGGTINETLNESTPYFHENGTPVMGNGRELPAHGIYPTSYYEYSIGNFSPVETVHNYLPGSFDDTALGEIKKFQLLVEGYSSVHIDAYGNLLDREGKITFSPFSHDAHGHINPVPEPASMLLLGSGMIGLAAWGRRKFQKNYLPQ